MYNYQIVINLSQFRARTINDINLLTKKNEYLLDTKIDINDNEVIFNFNCDQSRLLNNIHLTYQEKLIVLFNLIKLYNSYNILDFSLNPNNVYIDYNLQPLILIRDIKGQTNIDYINCIKAEIGYLLDQKYSYFDYLDGGDDLLLNNGANEFLGLNTIDDIQEKLIVLLNKVDNIIDTDYSLIKNNKIKKDKILKSILFVGLILLLVCSGYLYFNNKQIMQKNDLYTAYVSENYNEVIANSKKININKANTEELYVIARSVIITQKLEDKIKEELLSQVSINGDIELLKYWVLLGQEEFEQAIDIAYSLNDKNLSIYANLKYLDYINNDSSLSTDKKEEKRKKIESQLKELGVEINNK